MESYLHKLKKQFNDKIEFREKRAGVKQLIAPFFHEDGDMIDIFITESPSAPGKIRICDYGLTLMHLSYTYDIDTPNKERILDNIISENGLQREDGNIFVDVAPDMMYPYIFQFSQTVGKVSSMQYFKREVIRSLFYEQLTEFIEINLTDYKPKAKVYPIPTRDDLEVDFSFNCANKPIYLFGIRDEAKARIVTISCLEFQKSNLPFRSMAVHEDMETLPKKDKQRITSAVDKHFFDLEDFKKNGRSYLDREAV